MDDEITTIKKYLERLKGYSCGYHIQLEKQMLNRIKLLKSLKPSDNNSSRKDCYTKCKNNVDGNCLRYAYHSDCNKWKSSPF